MGYNKDYFLLTGQKISTADLSKQQLALVGRTPKKTTTAPTPSSSKTSWDSNANALLAESQALRSGGSTTTAVPKSVTDSIKASAVANNWSDTQLNNALQAASTRYAPSIPKSTVPTNAGSIPSPFSPVQTPTITPDLGNISLATAGMGGYQSFLDANKGFYEQQMQMQQQQSAKQDSMLQKFLGSVQSPTEARAQAQQETGIDVQKYFAKQEAGVKEIESLTKDYNKVVAMKDQQIAQTHDKLASMNFINNQVAQIERNAAPQLNQLSANINAKAAALQAQQGNFAEAQAYVNQAVQDATAETKFQFDMYQMLYQNNQESFDRLNAIYTNAYNTSMNIAQTAYEQQRAEKQTIGNLLLEYPTAGIDIYADSLDEAYRKAGLVPPTATGGSKESLTADMKNFLFAQENPAFADFMGKNGSGTTANYTQVMQAAIDAGASPEEASRAAASVSEGDGIPVDQKTLSSWTAYARQLSPTPVQPAEQTISAPSGTYSSSSGGGVTLTSLWKSVTGALFGD